jgi:A/G-specific adenine glycosylase
VDVNVGRVLERSGREFGPESAQALFDLGATVCLARIPRCSVCPLAEGCPSLGRRFEPARKQGPFEGSFRQRRARLLRLVAQEPQPVETDPEAVAALHRDGLVQVDSGLVSLPS